MKYKGQFEIYDNIKLVADRYAYGGGIALLIYAEDGDPICDLSANLQPPLGGNMMAVDHNFSKEHLAFIEENKIGRQVESRSQGYAVFPIVELDIERLKALVTDGKEHLDHKSL